MSGQMKLLLSKPRGFCAGVERAIETVEKALERFGQPIYVKHQIVHNKHVVERLRNRGAVFVEDLDEVPQGARIIYSAHGVSPEVRAHAKRRSLIEIDATCVLVTRIHSAVLRYAKQGYHIILIGHRNHVEVTGTAGEAPHVTHVVEKVADVEKLSFPPDTKLLFITQTTLSLDDVAEVAAVLRQRYPHIETLPSSSICYATQNRQIALRAITGDTDVVIVVGDPQSSNSNRLCEVAKRRNIPAHLILDENDIDATWFHGVTTIGLSAGASTPEDVVQRCILRLRALGVSEVRDVVHTQEDVVFALPKALETTS